VEFPGIKGKYPGKFPGCKKNGTFFFRLGKPMKLCEVEKPWAGKCLVPESEPNESVQE